MMNKMFFGVVLALIMLNNISLVFGSDDISSLEERQRRVEELKDKLRKNTNDYNSTEINAAQLATPVDE